MRKNKDLAGLFEVTDESLRNIIGLAAIGDESVGPVVVIGPVAKTTVPGGGSGDATQSSYEHGESTEDNVAAD